VRKGWASSVIGGTEGDSILGTTEGGIPVATEASKQAELPSEQGLGERITPESIRRHRYDESTNRYSILWRCPHCEKFNVHTAYATTIDRVFQEGSEKAPLRAFCENTDCQGKRHGRPSTQVNPNSPINPKGGRGRTQVRLISRDVNLGILQVPVKNKSRLDLVKDNLNLCLHHGATVTRKDVIKEYDPSWTEGRQEPKASRRIGGGF
jgi:hypothetical protein